MGSYCRVVVHRSRATVEPVLLKTFEAESIVSAADAEPGDLFFSEGNDAVALDENDAGSLLTFLDDKAVKLLTDLSRQCDARITAIAVQTGVVLVSILVVDRGTVVRRYVECEGKIETDEGQLPEWEDRIRSHAWNAADRIVGILPWTPPPSMIGTALRALGRSIGLMSAKQVESKPVVMPSGLLFGKPVGVIPTKRYRDRRNPKVASCRIEGTRLVCVLEDGSELIVSPADIKKPASNPFTKTGTYLSFRDHQFMKLPDSVEFSDIEQWFKGL